VLLRPTKCQGDNDTIPTESSLGGAVAVIPEKGERKAREQAGGDTRVTKPEKKR
jgi:hypothetical protein